jgi:hypothetical protein
MSPSLGLPMKANNSALLDLSALNPNKREPKDFIGKGAMGQVHKGKHRPPTFNLYTCSLFIFCVFFLFPHGYTRVVGHCIYLYLLLNPSPFSLSLFFLSLLLLSPYVQQPIKETPL